MRQDSQIAQPQIFNNCYDADDQFLYTSDASLAGSVDDVSSAITIIDFPHHEIHEGDHFYIQGFLDLDYGDTFYMKLVTPNSAKWSHFIFDIKSSGICTTYLDEDASGGMAGGVSVTALNNNRNSSNTSGMVFTSNVTNATAFVTRLESDKWGADGFKSTSGGGGAREDELLLKADTIYLRSFISGSNSNLIQFKASWYEHTTP